MKLDILLPTYNRSQILNYQLMNIEKLRALNEFKELSINVIVSDNFSMPSVEIESRFDSFCTLIKPHQHLPTVEEHLRFIITQSSADYIWLLSDEDPPILESMPALFSALMTAKPDIMVLNASGILTDGAIIPLRTTTSKPHDISSFPEFVQRTGILFVAAGISCIVMKADLAKRNIEALDDYMKICPIYSHVFWMLETFWDQRFHYLPRPAVLYKQNISDVEGNHWIKSANDRKVFQHFYWTLGLLRKMALLRNRRPVEPLFFKQVVDQTWTKRFQLTRTIAEHFFEQLATEKNGKTNCRPSTDEEKAETVRLLLDFDPSLSPYFHGYIKQQGNLSVSELKELAKILFDSAYNYFDLFLIAEYRHFKIYHLDGKYRAILASSSKQIQRFLKDVAPACSPLEVAADSLEQVHSEIDQIFASAKSSFDTYAFIQYQANFDENNGLTARETRILKWLSSFLEKVRRTLLIVVRR